MREGAATTPVGMRKRPAPTIAVIGNPNAGKSTIFNRLTGLSQRVGNYPGVTVEKKVGQCALGTVEARLIDLPGTYSLAAHSPDEMVAVDLLLGHLSGEARPDLVLQIVDASNLERNLYLFSQVRELGLPVVLALNMTDVATARGVHVDADNLSRALGVPVVPVQGHRGTGLGRLREVLRDALERAGRDGEESRPVEPFCFEGEMPVEVDRLREAFASG
ncbi:MAG TPA: FeoB small GTPase domain-containing protein, partial [Planctomycetota bacterium]|nr:FeoB small GTPase domain-containing protein [Planctomycetota bacterium]